MTTARPLALAPLLRQGEWSSTEFKAARNALPKSAFETVSAFANTSGGWLVPGVEQHGEQFSVNGVAEPDKLQNDLLSVLNADGKTNHDVQVTAHHWQHGGKTVLGFHIAENPRTRKAGTGLRIMRREWQALGHAQPTHRNDRANKAFEIFLPDTVSRVAWMAGQEQIDLVTPEVQRLLQTLHGTMNRRELMRALGLKDEKHFRQQYQQAAVALGLIEITLPDKPRSRLQRYRLTETGQYLLVSQRKSS